MTLSVHPLAELFPAMTDVEFDALVADIRANGVIDPIVVHEGMILDGRNRYRACLEIGIDPLTRQWDGKGDALGYVVSKNLCRRHLDEGQRAMVSAKIANMKEGRPAKTVPIGTVSEVAQISTAEAAQMMNVSVRSVRRARAVLSRGIPELQAAVETGAVSVNAAATVAYMPVAEQRAVVNQGPAAVMQAAKAARPPSPKLTVVEPPVDDDPVVRSPIGVPDGITVEAHVRSGMARETDGMTGEQVGKELGISKVTYRKVRDLIMLLDEIDLTDADRAIVSRALATINRTKQLAGYDAAEPVVRRVWGSNLKNHRSMRTAQKRVEHFATVVGLTVQSCANLTLKEFEVPYLSDAERRRWTKELEAARRSLDEFIAILKN